MANVIIQPGLRADIMRKQMETKQQLQNKGDLYVGTGEQDADNVYETNTLSAGANNTVLMCDSSVAKLGLKYNKIGNDNFDNSCHLPITTIYEAPTADNNNSNGLILVVLNQVPSVMYNGYCYMIVDD